MKKIQFFAALLAAAVIFSSCSIDMLFIKHGRKNKIPEPSASVETTAQPTTEAIATEPDSNGRASYRGPAYNMLNEGSKLLYDKMDSAIFVDVYWESEVTVQAGLSLPEIAATVDAFSDDHPEAFWYEQKYSYIDNSDSTTIYPEFNLKQSEFEKRKTAFENAVDKIISDAPQNASDFEKERYVHDYLTENCEYDHKAAEKEERLGNEGNAYGAIVERKAVCEGYARAFQLLCNRLGLDCVCVTGMTDEGLHEWNCVKLENEWYNVDVTWDDPDEWEDKIFVPRYFNLSDKMFFEDHTPSDTYDKATCEVISNGEGAFNSFVPKCGGTKYSYYSYLYPTLTDIEDYDSVIDSIVDSINSGDDYTYINVSDELDLEETFKSIVKDGYLYDWIRVANSEAEELQVNPVCAVSKLDNLRVISISLEYD